MPKSRQRPPAARRANADSNTFRFFVPPGTIDGRRVVIRDKALLHQLGGVLRLGPGDRITLLDNSGWEYTVLLDELSRDIAGGTIERKGLADTEPHLKLALYIALLRGERFEWVLQKATELGASAFVPVVCQRSVVDDIAGIGATKLERWERIIREAAEQSRRAKLPKLLPAMLFEAACEHAKRRSEVFLLWEGSGATALRTLLQARVSLDATRDPAQPAPLTVSLLSGPEGGFTDSELDIAARYGIGLASLGPRTLRAETAPIAAATAVLFAGGDLD